jgi:hypothetical protein
MEMEGVGTALTMQFMSQEWGNNEKELGTLINSKEHSSCEPSAYSELSREKKNRILLCLNLCILGFFFLLEQYNLSLTNMEICVKSKIQL